MIEIEVAQDEFKRAADLPSQWDIKIVNGTGYTVTDTDGHDAIFVTTGADDRVILLPAVANNLGRKLVIMKTDDGVGKVIVDGNSLEKIVVGGTEYETRDLESKGAKITIICYNGGWWNIISRVTKDYVNNNGEIYSIKETNGTKLQSKVVEIGTWNMNLTTTVVIPSGVNDHTKIRSVQAMIRSDVDSVCYDFAGTEDVSSHHYIRVQDTDIVLSRALNGFFDSDVFDTMGDDGNRGWITIWYEV